MQALDIPEELHSRKMSELQGGQKVRVLLAQALFGHPQALLLDEPTNHLDLDSIHWLQGFLNTYDGIVITISPPAAASAIVAQTRPPFVLSASALPATMSKPVT